MNQDENKRIIMVFIGLVILVLTLIIYLSVFTTFEAKKIISHPANRREEKKVAKIRRGNIYDSAHEALALTEGEVPKYTRRYPYNKAYSHMIGYSSKVLGNSGLEAAYNSMLLGEDNRHAINLIRALFDKSIDLNTGNDLELTTNSNIQEYASKKLEALGEKGAVVVLNPKTGAIYAMVSNPTFDVQEIDKNYDSIVKQNEGALFYNAIQGGYAPGSTFKILTSIAILESGIDRHYKDEGEVEIAGRAIKNAGEKIYGEIDLDEAFTNSVNTYFAKKAVEIGKAKMTEVAERALFNTKINFDLDTSRSGLAISKFNSKNWDDHALASAGIGQADLLVTPLHMAMIAGAISNSGKMYKPYLVKKATNSVGQTVYEAEDEVIAEIASPQIANEIANLMRNSVTKGTSKGANVRGVEVAGKTGTAQKKQDSNIYDAWFVGFAPKDNAEIAVAVIIQNVEKLGGEIAAPFAADIIKYSLEELE